MMDFATDATRHYLTLYRHFAQFDEQQCFSRALTRCLMQGVVYKDFGGMAFGEFVEPFGEGHFYIWGWAGHGTLSRFFDQYLVNHPDGPHMRMVSWTRVRKDGSRQPCGPHDYNRLRKILSHVHQR